MSVKNLGDFEFLKKSTDVDLLCDPIKKHLGVNYFNYVRLNKDNSRVLLTNQPEWIESFYKNKLYKEKSVIDIERLKFDKYFSWRNFKDEKPFLIGREYYDIDHGITLINTSGDLTELFYFATNKHNLNINYEEKLEFLWRFVLFFKDSGRKVINFASDRPLLLKDFKNEFKIQDKTLEEKLGLVSGSDKFRLVYKQQGKEFLLSRRETECAAFLMLQFSMKEMSDRLGISNRTVEEYVNNIKRKLGCFSKQALINGLLDLHAADISRNVKLDKRFPLSNKMHPDKNSKNYVESTHYKRLYLDEIALDLYLTKREGECLYFLCSGFSYKKIAKKINSSEKTVAEYLSKLRTKFRVRKKSQLVSLCVKHNILDKLAATFGWADISLGT